MVCGAPDWNFGFRISPILLASATLNLPNVDLSVIGTSIVLTAREGSPHRDGNLNVTEALERESGKQHMISELCLVSFRVPQSLSGRTRCGGDVQGKHRVLPILAHLHQ